jgi:hypothetical protein
MRGGRSRSRSQRSSREEDQEQEQEQEQEEQDEEVKEVPPATTAIAALATMMEQQVCRAGTVP